MSTKRTQIKLATVDDLFKTQYEREEDKHEKIMEIPLNELHTFKNHPFKVSQNEELHELAKSIRENGVVTPAIARPRKGGGYELIAGHRRKAACEMAGLTTMPVVVRELNDDSATIIMVDSNQQRENLLPSEKAFSYKMKLEAIKRQGKRTDLTSRQVVTKLRSDDELAENANESGRQIQRYIRLTNLIPAILKMVDQKHMAFNPAVEISYLPEEEQRTLHEIMEMQQCTPSLSQARLMKKMSAEGKLNKDIMLGMLAGEKPNQKEKLTIKRDRIEKYFPRDYTLQQIEDTIMKLLNDWYKKRHREREQSR